jgi:superfamily II RNA helicase
MANRPGTTTALVKYIGCVVFDECHYITESDRVSAYSAYVCCTVHDIFTVFMSATIPQRLLNSPISRAAA